ncbi:hypothetical protein [Bacillus sp. P14.5]|uniref:hypothetical protein n=1 Tax=Bacillus sp. P14.5 TaxID=1983400 RepID=UPI0013B06C4C|nr:hypothetical protein [Bacillus sp. P14.5]
MKELLWVLVRKRWIRATEKGRQQRYWSASVGYGPLRRGDSRDTGPQALDTGH